MKKLSEFLTEFICKSTAFQEKWFIEKITEGVEAYKKHLQVDIPKTANWAMRENELIIALERMESVEHSELDKISDGTS